MVWNAFKQSFEGDYDIHICMGDLFDKPYVSYDLIVQVANFYMETSYKRRSSEFVVLKGNHDWTRDLTKISAFDLFARLTQTKVLCLDKPMVASGWPQLSGQSVAFCPYDPVKPAAEIIAGLPEVEVYFGHWDVDRRSPPHNLVPYELLEGKTVYTGHDHIARVENGVNVVGSLQPYSHGEDPNETLYVTRPLSYVRENADEFTNKCLRVDLAPGEALDFPVDCLQLSVRRVGTDGRVDDDISVESDFDLDRLFNEALEGSSVAALVRDKFNELRSS
jgi:hypothetical protein